MTAPPSSVLTMGTFDLIHPGHIELFHQLRRLAGLGGHVTVAVNSDDFVERFKHRRPTMSTDERVALVRALKDVDRVLVNDGTDQAALIKQAKPDYLVIGADWAQRDYMAQLGISHTWLAENRVVLLYMAHAKSDAISSTRVRARVVGEHGPELAADA